MQHKERKKAKKKKKKNGYMDVLRWKKYTKITIGTLNKIEVAAAMDFECHCCQIDFTNWHCFTSYFQKVKKCSAYKLETWLDYKFINLKHLIDS